MPDLDTYLALIPSEHRDKPLYVQTIAVTLQGGVDAQALLEGMPELFDLDTAVGDQLDKTGQWIGLDRHIAIPLDIWFTWTTSEPLPIVDFAWGTTDAAGWGRGSWDGTPPSPPVPLTLRHPGWGQGYWLSAFTPGSETVSLDDEHYRILLKARVVANHWDGTIPGAYTAWNTLFASEGYKIFIQDGLPASRDFFAWGTEDVGWSEGSWFTPGAEVGFYVGDMTIDVGLIAPADTVTIDAVTMALFTGGYLGLRPGGVAVRYYATQSVIGRPMFGWGAGPVPAPVSFFTWGRQDLGWGQGEWPGTLPPPPPDVIVAPPTLMAGWEQGAWPLLTVGEPNVD